MNFNDYVKNKADSPKLTPQNKKMLSEFLAKYDGKSQDELLDSIIETAKQNKANGKLSNQDIDSFASMILPMLNAEQKNKLKTVIEQLKNS